MMFDPLLISGTKRKSSLEYDKHIYLRSHEIVHRMEAHEPIPRAIAVGLKDNPVLKEVFFDISDTILAHYATKREIEDVIENIPADVGLCSHVLLARGFIATPGILSRG